MKGSAGAAGGILLRQKESRRRGGREEEADEFGEVSIHLHDVREIEKQSRQSDAGFSESGGYGTEKIPAPPADECIKALRWDEGPAFGIDADTGLAVARTEPPLEALDENGVLHLAVKVSSASTCHSVGNHAHHSRLRMECLAVPRSTLFSLRDLHQLN